VIFALVNSGGITLAATLFIRLAATAARAGVVVHAAIGDAILIILVLSVIHVGAVAAATTAARHAEGNKATAAATAAFLFTLAIAAATAATATGHAAAAFLVGFTSNVAAGAVLRKLVKLCQTLGVLARIPNHAEQNLSLLHIGQIVSQVFIIIAQLHFIVNGKLNPFAKARGFLNANLANAVAAAGKLPQNLLQQSVMAALVQAELAEHLFIHLALGMLHHAAVKQLRLAGAQHNLLKNILHAQGAVGALAIVVKRNITTGTQSIGHNMDLLFLSMEYSYYSVCFSRPEVLVPNQLAI
jgi:hypothetical protein